MNWLDDLLDAFLGFMLFVVMGIVISLQVALAILPLFLALHPDVGGLAWLLLYFIVIPLLIFFYNLGG